MKCIRLVTAAAFALLLVSSLAGQTFRSGVNLIVLQVSVTDQTGHVVNGLTRDEFSVYEDDGLRKIEQFSAEQVPVSLGILIDISGSMLGQRFSDAQEALSKLLERFHEEDQIFMAVFNSSFKLLVPWTSDHPTLLRALSNVEPRGGTYLYSSISSALPILNAGANRKKALVIISDGDDNEKMAGLNRPLLDRAVQQARQSEALIYVIGIGVAKPPMNEFFDLDPETRRKFFYDPPVDVDVMRRLTDPTGGYTQLTVSSANLAQSVISIADDLSAQYMIAFESEHADGKYHTLKVTTRNPRYKVRARTGYVNP